MLVQQVTLVLDCQPPDRQPPTACRPIAPTAALPGVHREMSADVSLVRRTVGWLGGWVAGAWGGGGGGEDRRQEGR